jgi:hypothetical protein
MSFEWRRRKDGVRSMSREVLDGGVRLSGEGSLSQKECLCGCDRGISTRSVVMSVVVKGLKR